jgi:hypothetical protein
LSNSSAQKSQEHAGHERSLVGSLPKELAKLAFELCADAWNTLQNERGKDIEEASNVVQIVHSPARFDNYVTPSAPPLSKT